MASNNTLNLPHVSDSNTTFVQADPSTFRAVVQKLTGAPENPGTQRLTGTSFPRPSEMGRRRPAFKLHERRQRKLEIKLSNENQVGFVGAPSGLSGNSFGFAMVSPVSTLDLFARGSPKTPCEEEEERAIAKKGFYLHPNTPRGADPPQLLPLFPLHSPGENNSD